MPANEASEAELHWVWEAKRPLSAHLLLSCPGRRYQTSLPPVQDDRDKHFVTDKFNLTSSSKNVLWETVFSPEIANQGNFLGLIKWCIRQTERSAPC